MVRPLNIGQIYHQTQRRRVTGPNALTDAYATGQSLNLPPGNLTTGENHNTPMNGHIKRHSQATEINTPRIITKIQPKKLFDSRRIIYKESYEERNKNNNINKDIEDINMEILLLNTLTITGVKVQTLVEKFIKDKTYTSIFGFTEIKVESLNFIPIGIKIFSKHREKKEKRVEDL